MKLYIMRHAQASFSAPTDRERPITEFGIQQTKALLLASAKPLSDVNMIWSSDLLRAKQTASLASTILGADVSEKLFLSPDGDVRTVMGALQAIDANACLLIVSHQPLVGELISFLLHGNLHQAHPYTTSEILTLDLDIVGPGMATLVKQYLPVC